MQITMKSTGPKAGEVVFKSPAGEGRGIWCGGPLPEGPVEVEFEFPELLTRWLDVAPAEEPGERIRTENGKVGFTGILESIDEDGTACLRLDGSILMFECMGEPLPVGGWVEAWAAEIRIYPVYL
ncbi:hypothetical protein ACE6ED_27490 [Paenibacillus sp. CN-4]|uniref:hypothetical protein n=1 Tax=Paenibacillus nanchangensis TaxID=3348343 RepID=UPI00397A8129